MVKLRSAYYCNLKLLLIFLVVWGHLLEPNLSDPAAYRLYRFIYLFHIPLFAFVSGLFLKDSAGCLRQLRRMLPLYILCQAAAVALGQARWHTPWWILWYLLSLCCWLLLSALFLRFPRGKWWILALSVAVGCVAGQIPWVGRPFSLSRTLVFFPWFWLGVILKPDLPWHRLRLPALLVLLLPEPNISAGVLYQAGPCDPLLRLACYGYALALSLLILSWCPRRRFPWTRAGADTLPAYLLHAPLVRLLPPIRHPALFAALFLYLIHKATQWRGIYGIIGKEDTQWPDSKTYTKPRANRSTGSSWP